MRATFLLLLSTAFTQIAYSQNDSLFFAVLSEAKTIKDLNEPIFNGREHVNYHPAIQGTAYYPTGDWQQGSLIFQNIPYKNLSLKYDVVADELVVLHKDGFTGVVLFTPRIQSFALGKNVFNYLQANEAPSSRAGIYEQLVKGKVSLYAKRSKVIVENIVSNTLERKFVNYYSFYVLKDGQYHAVKKQKDVMALVGEKKNEITAWMKSSGIRFKSNPEQAMIQIIERYNQLSR
jgi:hypothetical protein